jgi:hypothetical protein
MRPTEYPAALLADLLRERTIATMPELMAALGTDARRTVFRKLKELHYRTSYSHRGAYYTLDDVAEFDELGLWAYEDVWFSMHGTLLSTAEAMVEAADLGFFTEELDNVLHVATKDALGKLVRDDRLAREEFRGRFLYCAADANRRGKQLSRRRARLEGAGVLAAVAEPTVLPEELKAAIVLFFSLLDEKQRRLYAGIEALKVGSGGDALIADLLGIAPSTVARGRRELLSGEISVGRVRKPGGGRKQTKKKRRS